MTADHSHTLSINGYPARGNSILGLAHPADDHQVPYTTLTYATGGPDGFQMKIDPNTGKPVRMDPSTADTTAYDYVQQVGVETTENTHGGVDVPIHAIGLCLFVRSRPFFTITIRIPIWLWNRSNGSYVPSCARTIVCGPCYHVCGPYWTISWQQSGTIIYGNARIVIFIVYTFNVKWKQQQQYINISVLFTFYLYISFFLLACNIS